MHKSDKVQKILKEKYMDGPKVMMEDDLIGINYFSGNEQSAYYELYGKSTIFRLIVILPSENLYTSSFVGKSHLLFLLLEEDKVKGGFVSEAESFEGEFLKTFDFLPDDQAKELLDLWKNFVSEHYYEKINSKQ